MERGPLICNKCNRELVKKEVRFVYMEHHFTHEADACPVCGQVWLSEETVNGRMKELEQVLEEK